MASHKCSKVWLYFTMIDRDSARCNLYDSMKRAPKGNILNYGKPLIKHSTYLNAEECEVFDSLRMNHASSQSSPEDDSGSVFTSSEVLT